MGVFTENGMMIDLEELRKVVENADVFAIGFRTFPERLIVDARSSEHAGTMVQVVEPVASVEERFFWLGKERPAFGVPERFTFFVWPHSLRFFEESGLGQIIRERVNNQAPKPGARWPKACTGCSSWSTSPRSTRSPARTTTPSGSAKTSAAQPQHTGPSRQRRPFSLCVAAAGCSIAVDNALTRQEEERWNGARSTPGHGRTPSDSYRPTRSLPRRRYSSAPARPPSTRTAPR